MSNILICVPTLDRVDASHYSSMLALRYDSRHQYSRYVISNSLTYNARNAFANAAISHGFDLVIMIDADMVLDPETVNQLVTDIEESGADLVTGLYFKRRQPAEPVILSWLDWYEHEKLGPQEIAETYEDYPRGEIFDIAGCGMGCCIMRTQLLKDVTIAYKYAPFTPLPRLSEDYAFCFRAKQIGATLMCDSRILPKHAGLKLYGEEDWLKHKEGEHA